MISYLTPVAEYRAETVIRHSRFIAVTAPINDYESGLAFVAALRKEFSDATHVCYAFISDEAGNEQKFSDDGEPGGTAGQPILETLKKRGLKKTVLAVVRYFGGIKLGTGGLTAAYGGSGGTVLDGATLADMRYSVIFKASVGYGAGGKLQSLISANAATIDVNYDNGITVTAAVEEESAAELFAKLLDATAGAVVTEVVRKEYYPYSRR